MLRCSSYEGAAKARKPTLSATELARPAAHRISYGFPSVDNSVGNQLIGCEFEARNYQEVSRMTTALLQESQTYRDSLQAMLGAHDGQYVVIKGESLSHFAESYQDALEWAYDKFGLDDFFVKRVSSDQGLSHFTRDLGPCRT